MKGKKRWFLGLVVGVILIFAMAKMGKTQMTKEILGVVVVGWTAGAILTLFYKKHLELTAMSIIWRIVASGIIVPFIWYSVKYGSAGMKKIFTAITGISITPLAVLIGIVVILVPVIIGIGIISISALKGVDSIRDMLDEIFSSEEKDLQSTPPTTKPTSSDYRKKLEEARKKNLSA